MQGFKWSIQNLQCSTFLSWGSICFQLLAFNWWSSSNFILIFSMDNCSISQNPAKSWEVGRGCALGFCTTEEEKNNSWALVPLNVKHLCKWLWILLGKQFQQREPSRRHERETTASTDWVFICKGAVAASSHCAPMGSWTPPVGSRVSSEEGFPAILMLAGTLGPVKVYCCCMYT